MSQNLLQLRDSYDWIVLGYNIGSLISANLVSRLGLSVLLVEVGENSDAEVFFSRSGQVFDPTGNFQLGFYSEYFQEILRACLIQKEELTDLIGNRKLIQDQDYCTTLLRGSSFDWNSNFDLFWDELKFNYDEKDLNQYLPKEELRKLLEEIAIFWKGYLERLDTDESYKGTHSSLDSKGIFFRLLENIYKHSTFKDLLVQLCKKRSSGMMGLKSTENLFNYFEQLKLLDKNKVDLFLLFESHWKNFTGLSLKKAENYLLFNLIWLGMTSEHFKGGIKQFKKLLLKKAFENGAHILSNDKTGSQYNVRKIFVDNGSFVGIQLPQFGKMISTKGGIIGCGFHEVESLLSKDRRLFSRPLYKKNARANKVRAWKFTLALTVNRKVFSDSNLPCFLVQQNGAPSIEVEVVECRHYEFGYSSPVAANVKLNTPDSDRVFVFLRTQLPFLPNTLEEGFLRKTASKMYREVCSKIPFLFENTLRIFPNIFKEDSELKAPMIKSDLKNEYISDFFEAYPFSSIDQIASNLLIYEDGFNSYQTPIRGLFCGTEQAYPDVGNFSGIVSAIEATSWIAHKSGLRGPIVSSKN